MKSVSPKVPNTYGLNILMITTINEANIYVNVFKVV